MDGPAEMGKQSQVMFHVYVCISNAVTFSIKTLSIPYFIDYSMHFFTWKMMLKYFIRTIHGR
jgi:hypothetical protein